jgi:hypothetical protein
MAIQFIQFNETLIKVTPLVSELPAFTTLQKRVTAPSDSAFNNSAIAWLLLFVVKPKKAKVHFCTQKI